MFVKVPLQAGRPSKDIDKTPPDAQAARSAARSAYWNTKVNVERTYVFAVFVCSGPINKICWSGPKKEARGFRSYESKPCKHFANLGTWKSRIWESNTKKNIKVSESKSVPPKMSARSGLARKRLRGPHLGPSQAIFPWSGKNENSPNPNSWRPKCRQGLD